MDILKLKFQNIDPYLIKSKVLKNNGQEDKNFYEYKIPNFTNDQSHNYLISIPFKHIDHPKYVIFSLSKNQLFTAFLYLTQSFDFELIVLKNNFVGENLEYVSYASFKLKDLNIFNEKDKTEENFDLLMKLSLLSNNLWNAKNPNFKISYFKKGSEEKREEANDCYKFPAIHLVTNNSIILETNDKIFLINFESSKITTLLNKSSRNDLKIIYTYDEYVTVSRIKKSFLRTYVFCLDKKKCLHYFYLEENDIALKDKKIILHKMPYAGNDILEMLIICMSLKSENGKYFFFVFLTRTKIRFFITDYYDNDLGFLLNLMNFKENERIKKFYFNKDHSAAVAANNESGAISSDSQSSSTKKKDRKFDKFSKILKSNTGRIEQLARRGSLVDFNKVEFQQNLENHENTIKRIYLNEENEFYYLSFLEDHAIYTIKFEKDLPPNKLKEKFKLNNFIEGSAGRMLLKMSNLFSLKDKNLSDILSLKKKKAEANSPDNYNEENANINTITFDYFLLQFNELDYSYKTDLLNYDFNVKDLDISICKGRMTVVSQNKLYLISLNEKGKKFYFHILKDDCFKGILDYSQINNNQYLLTNKGLFKFRHYKEFNDFENFLLAISKAQENRLYTEDREVEFNNMFLKELKDLLINILQELNNFYPNKENSLCSHCLKPGKVACPDCQTSFYCNEQELKKEKRSQHFFECCIRKFLNTGKNLLVQQKTLKVNLLHYNYAISSRNYWENESNKYNEKFLMVILNEFLLMIYDVFEEIFLAIEENCLIQEYLIFIRMLILLMEKAGAKFCLINHQMINSTKKTDFKPSLKFLLNEFIQLFLNLKFLYLKFCIESNNTDLAIYEMSLLRVQYLENLQRFENHNLKINFMSNFFDTNKQNGNQAEDKLTIIERFEKNTERKNINNFITFFINSKSKILKFLSKLKIIDDHNMILNYLDEITTFFENYLQDNRVLAYVYFFVSFHLIKYNKFEWAVMLLYMVKDIAKNNKFQELEFTASYNLGMLNYALHHYTEGIHNFENTLRISKANKLSNHSKLVVLETLGFAHLNIFNFIHAFLNIKETITLLTFKSDMQSKLKINTQKIYLTFIIEMIQQIGVLLRSENQKNEYSVNKKKNKDFELECRKLIQCINESGFNDYRHTLSLYSVDFLKVIQFLNNLTPEELNYLNEENKLEILINKEKKENENLHHIYLHKNANFNNNQRDFLSYIQEKKLFRDLNISYTSELEVKKLYDSLPKNKQEILKTLNLDLIRRHVILKDAKNTIDHENLNYHPVYTPNLIYLIEDIKSDNQTRFLSENLFKNDKQYAIILQEIKNRQTKLLYALSLYMNKPQIIRNLTIENSKTKSQFYTKNVIKSPIMRTYNVKQKISNNSNILRELKKGYKIPFEYFHEKLTSIEEYNVIDNISDILKKIYDEIGDPTFLTYILENPDILKSFLYTDTSNLNANLFDNFTQKDDHSRTNALKYSQKAAARSKAENYNKNFNKTYDKSLIENVNEKNTPQIMHSKLMEEEGNRKYRKASEAKNYSILNTDFRNIHQLKNRGNSVFIPQKKAFHKDKTLEAHKNSKKKKSEYFNDDFIKNKISSLLNDKHDKPKKLDKSQMTNNLNNVSCMTRKSLTSKNLPILSHFQKNENNKKSLSEKNIQAIEARHILTE